MLMTKLVQLELGSMTTDRFKFYGPDPNRKTRERRCRRESLKKKKKVGGWLGWGWLRLRERERWVSSWSLRRIWCWGWWRIRRRGIGSRGSTSTAWRRGARRPRRCGASPSVPTASGPSTATTPSSHGTPRSARSPADATPTTTSSRTWHAPHRPLPLPTDTLFLSQVRRDVGCEISRLFSVAYICISG